MRRRWAWAIALAPAMAIAGIAATGVGQAAVRTQLGTSAQHAGGVAPNHVNQMDCYGYSPKYKSLSPGFRSRCTDRVGRFKIVKVHGKTVIRSSRPEDNGHYLGHDEPVVKFISAAAGSGNTMTYFTKMPRDPARRPTANGSVTKYAELSIAPWFGLPLCDPRSYPQNPCNPRDDHNSGVITDPLAAGSALMELQFYPPGFAPFSDNASCSKTQWCFALTIDSVESKFNFVGLNPNCQEPVNFAFLQTNGRPAGPPSPQLANINTQTPNAHTLKVNPGDVVKVSITDPDAGLTTRVTDLTTHKSGFMVASAANGFKNTDFVTCKGFRHTFHAEYDTASQQNQVPWASLEAGVLMQQEIGHAEVCNRVTSRFPVSVRAGRTSFRDRNVFQVCKGGPSGPRAGGEGPCNPRTGICKHPTTEGRHGPVRCPTNNAASGRNCEFSNAVCFPKGSRTVITNGKARKDSQPVAMCLDNAFQGGDLDFDGPSYRNDWPNGSPRHPTSMRYIGPFDKAGDLYPQIQFETNAPQSEFLCNINTGAGCHVKPLGSKFYPFFTLNNTQKLGGVTTPVGACVWNFGNVLPGVTKRAFGRDAQYGTVDLARFGGTSTSPVMTNPAITGGCPTYTQP